MTGLPKLGRVYAGLPWHVKMRRFLEMVRGGRQLWRVRSARLALVPLYGEVSDPASSRFAIPTAAPDRGQPTGYAWLLRQGIPVGGNAREVGVWGMSV